MTNEALESIMLKSKVFFGAQMALFCGVYGSLIYSVVA